MVSILAQERILGASLGAGFAAAMVLYEQKLIYRSAAHSLESISGHPVAPSAPKLQRNQRFIILECKFGCSWRIIFGRRYELISKWNLIAFLLPVGHLNK
ncbi:uncharacterized protein LOC131051407 isoform X1 [Cryptomeria japonica]|uniref:uncharacterized protein LOC131051407 isoform X1 n=1 Tax=Cryptomeria japonica TaxID=3369 RepID=UPI0027DA6BEE|nr:uncharacterized protein LOC131051407 isoform X1 [Cryptomeria japonica]